MSERRYVPRSEAETTGLLQTTLLELVAERLEQQHTQAKLGVTLYVPD